MLLRTEKCPLLTFPLAPLPALSSFPVWKTRPVSPLNTVPQGSTDRLEIFWAHASVHRVLQVTLRATGDMHPTVNLLLGHFKYWHNNANYGNSQVGLLCEQKIKGNKLRLRYSFLEFSTRENLSDQWQILGDHSMGSLLCSAAVTACQSTVLQPGLLGWRHLHSLYFYRCFHDAEHKLCGAKALWLLFLLPCLGKERPRPLRSRQLRRAVGIASPFILNFWASPGSDARKYMVNALITIIKSCQFNYSWEY